MSARTLTAAHTRHGEHVEDNLVLRKTRAVVHVVERGRADEAIQRRGCGQKWSNLVRLTTTRNTQRIERNAYS